MRITFCTMIIVSMVLLVSATVWEGVSEADSARQGPGTNSVATKTIPRNTALDNTKHENGKVVRVRVVSGLEQAGLLAMLSRTAAESIDLRGNSSVRIRMTQPSDDIAFSLFNLGPINPASSLATGKGNNTAQQFAADQVAINQEAINNDVADIATNGGATAGAARKAASP